MKRKIYKPALLIFLAVGTLFNAKAQKNERPGPFEKGSVTVNLGVGVGTNYNNSTNAFGTKAALEFGIWPAGPGVISLGLEIGGTFATKNNKNYWNDYRGRTIVIAARSAWHNGWGVKGLDTYAGVSAGPGFRHYDYNDRIYYENDDVIPVFGAFVGASYFFTRGFGVNVEAGSDITTLQAGVIFKLR